MKVILPRQVNKVPIHVVIDSTGVKIFGEGTSVVGDVRSLTNEDSIVEWKVCQHGYSRRRTWRKLHLAVNETC